MYEHSEKARASQQTDRETCPVWGSEFTIKIAAVQGDSSEVVATLNVKFWVLVARD
jgi:hypothetical protein